jgi:hypothetical protein
MNRSFELTGILLEKFEEKELATNFKKREFVLEVKSSSNYSESIVFSLVNSSCKYIDNLEIGDVLTVSFNIKGRKWISPEDETRYFNALDVHRVIKEENAESLSNVFSDTSGDGNDLDF